MLVWCCRLAAKMRGTISGGESRRPSKHGGSRADACRSRGLEPIIGNRRDVIATDDDWFERQSAFG